MPRNQIDSLFRTPAWQSLAPNFPNADDLDPQKLQPSTLCGIGDVAHSLADLSSATIQTDVGDFFRIGGSSEAKLASFRVLHNLGSIVVHVLPYAVDSAFVPQSRNLVPISVTPTQKLFEYSDPRTYAVVPWGDGTSVVFQEDGGIFSKRVYVPGMAAASRNRAYRNIKRAGITLTDPDRKKAAAEIAHPRHFLCKPGYIIPLIVDIPVVSR